MSTHHHQEVCFVLSNSSISSNGIYGSDAKVKTYTIGYDFKHNSDEQLTAADAKKTRDFSGLSFTYIKGSSSMNGYQVSDALQVAGGRSDIRGGSLTAYHTHTSQSGSYADYVLRYSSYDNDFKLDGVNGSAKSHGLQASAEYGCRLENDHGLFVTPNAQFTLGRLYNKAFTTSNGVHVASDHLNSAILSMGVDVGQNIGEQSQVYAKVRYNTELGDRVSAAFYQGDASSFRSGDSNGSWWEYGLASTSRQATPATSLWTLNALAAAASARTGPGASAHASTSKRSLSQNFLH